MSLQSFPTTHWSLILSSASTGESRSREALAQLCHDYWYPVYSFIRARTQSADQAQDLTQEFFLYLLNSSILRTADRSAGRFRSYLAACLKNFLADQSDRSSAQKRGGTTVIVPLDLADAESRYESDLACRETPEKTFDRQWAVEVVSRACDELEAALTRGSRALVSLSETISARRSGPVLTRGGCGRNGNERGSGQGRNSSPAPALR
jgi:RNA polymerase sigma factor (sigma-70 family)